MEDTPTVWKDGKEPDNLVYGYFHVNNRHDEGVTMGEMSKLTSATLSENTQVTFEEYALAADYVLGAMTILAKTSQLNVVDDDDLKEASKLLRQILVKMDLSGDSNDDWVRQEVSKALNGLYVMRLPIVELETRKGKEPIE